MKTFQRRSGFTLLELCSVVGVVALLFALTLPAFQRIREQARSSACLGNLRNWATAIAAYAGDHGGLLPQNEYPKDPSAPESGNLLFFHALAPYAGYKYPISDPAAFRKTILACPAETEFVKKPFYHYAMTADLNYRIQGSTPQLPRTSVRLQNLKNASTYVILSDSFESCVFYANTRAKMENFTNAFRRHGGVPNFLYADGHAQPFPATLVGYGDPGGTSPYWKNTWFANGLEPSKR